MDRRQDYLRMIRSKRWQRLRHDQLEAHPLCERCRSLGRWRSATEVHHVRPVEYERDEQKREELMFDADNLRSLCHDCHMETHRELRSGRAKQWREKRAERLQSAINALFPNTLADNDKAAAD